MRAKEMARESVAEPITGLGLDHPMLPLGMVVLAPGIVVARDIEGPLGSKSDLGAEIDRSCRII